MIGSGRDALNGDVDRSTGLASGSLGLWRSLVARVTGGQNKPPPYSPTDPSPNPRKPLPGLTFLVVLPPPAHTGTHTHPGPILDRTGDFSGDYSSSTMLKNDPDAAIAPDDPSANVYQWKMNESGSVIPSRKRARASSGSSLGRIGYRQ